MVGGERERLPQWSHGETKEFLGLRWELDRSFMETKRNKLLWELISVKMTEKGFIRTPDQCKCKWKNLVTRYKESTTMEAENNRTFAFHEEMGRIFSGRMERLLSFEEGKNPMEQAHVWSDEEEEDDMEMEKQTKNKRKKIATSRGFARGESSGGDNGKDDEMVKHALREFMRQQMEMEEQWLQAYEARETERRAMEIEWKNTMEAIAIERAEMDRRWREKEEERRDREEERAKRRHNLIVSVLTKLLN